MGLGSTGYDGRRYCWSLLLLLQLRRGILSPQQQTMPQTQQRTPRRPCAPDAPTQPRKVPKGDKEELGGRAHGGSVRNAWQRKRRSTRGFSLNISKTGTQTQTPAARRPRANAHSQRPGPAPAPVWPPDTTRTRAVVRTGHSHAQSPHKAQLFRDDKVCGAHDKIRATKSTKTLSPLCRQPTKSKKRWSECAARYPHFVVGTTKSGVRQSCEKPLYSSCLDTALVSLSANSIGPTK